MQEVSCVYNNNNNNNNRPLLELVFIIIFKYISNYSLYNAVLFNNVLI